MHCIRQHLKEEEEEPAAAAGGAGERQLDLPTCPQGPGGRERGKPAALQRLRRYHLWYHWLLMTASYRLGMLKCPARRNHMATPIDCTVRSYTMSVVDTLKPTR